MQQEVLLDFKQGAGGMAWSTLYLKMSPWLVYGEWLREKQVEVRIPGRKF